MPLAETHYDVLQVSPRATQAVIRAAWASLCRAHHPDAPGGNVRLIERINAAYNVLKDPQKREAYDAELLASRLEPIAPGRRRKNRSEQQPAQHAAGRRSYPATGAYPPPYPGVSFEQAFGEMLDDVTVAFKQEAQEAAMRLLEKTAATNPAVRAILDQYRKQQQRRKTS
jgi:curved DNA-binding protein CbpA